VRNTDSDDSADIRAKTRGYFQQSSLCDENSKLLPEISDDVPADREFGRRTTLHTDRAGVALQKN